MTRRDSLGGEPVSAEGKRLLSALEEAFPLTDKELLTQHRRKDKSDGTTALLVLVQGDELEQLSLFCAHVGDCRAVLCRGGSALRLTQDHRPDRKDEQQRSARRTAPQNTASTTFLHTLAVWRSLTCALLARPLCA